MFLDALKNRACSVFTGKDADEEVTHRLVGTKYDWILKASRHTCFSV